jgi:hypothetical protein
MNTANPDSFVRKEIRARLHNMEVDTLTIPCFDNRVVNSNSKNYILISTQLNQPNRTKCGRGWINSTELQVVVRQDKNTGSRVLLDNITTQVIEELDDFQLPTMDGMKVSLVELSVDNEFSQELQGEIITVKVVRLETTIN